MGKSQVILMNLKKESLFYLQSAFIKNTKPNLLVQKNIISKHLPEELTICKVKSDIDNQYFWNLCFDKGRIKSFVSWFLLNNGEFKTVALLDRLKTIGFESATKAGISLGIDDLKIPPKKLSLLYQAELETQFANQKYRRGDVLDVERFQRLISSWHRVSEVLKTEVVRHFEETNTLNPVYMMAFSGARGNISQVRQLVGMRGLMADPQGRIIDFPILSNFREGLSLTEYLISCYGARKGIVDTALRTANAGYLTRRLVDVAHHVIISHFDCGTTEGVTLTPMKEGNKLIYSLQNRLIGRVLAENIIQDGTIVALRNQEISHDIASRISNIKSKVSIRSPLTCLSKNLVCQLCYGWSLADGRLVSIGEAVGIIAAQSIGEPGTQLTMRTFHTGGVFSSDVSDQIKAPYDGIVHFLEPILGTLVRTPEGNIVFLTKADGNFIIQNTNNENQITKYKIPPFTLLFIRNKQKVFAKDLVAQITSITQQTAQRDDAEQTVLSDLEGQVFFASLRIRQYKSLGKIDSKSNKMEVWTLPINSKNKMIQSKDTNIIEEKRISETHLEQNKIGIVWLLSGKTYQFPIKTLSFIRVGDMITKNSPLNEISWYSSGDSLTFNKALSLPIVNSLYQTSYNKYNEKTSLFKNTIFPENKIFLIKNQFVIKSINYKKFGYLLNLQFKKLVSNKLLQSSKNQLLIKLHNNNIKVNYIIKNKVGHTNTLNLKNIPITDKEKQILIYPSTLTPLASYQKISRDNLNTKLNIYENKNLPVHQNKTLAKQFFNELIDNNKKTSVKEILHPSFILYSSKNQLNSGGLLFLENNLRFNKIDFHSNSILTKKVDKLISYLTNTLFSNVNNSAQDIYDSNILSQKLLDSSNYSSNQFYLALLKYIFLQNFNFKSIKNTDVSSSINKIKQSIVSQRLLKVINSSNLNNQNINDKLNYLQQEIRNSRIFNSRSIQNNFSFSTYKQESFYKYDRLLWIPQEFYTINGFNFNNTQYSNQSNSLILGVPSLTYTNKSHLLQTPLLIRNFSKKYKIDKSKSFAKTKFWQSNKSKVLNTLFRSNISNQNYYSKNLNKKIINKSSDWNLLKTTFNSQSDQYWIKNDLKSSIFVLNRQGKNRSISETKGLLTIKQKNISLYDASLISKKQLNKKYLNNHLVETLTNLQQVNNTLNKLSNLVPTKIINNRKHFIKASKQLKTINIKQLTHNYNIQIKKGIIYFPNNLSFTKNLTSNKSFIFPGQNALDDLCFHTPVYSEYFCTSKLVNQFNKQITIITKSNKKDINLKNFTWIIKNPKSRFNLNCELNSNLEKPLAVLIRTSKEISRQTAQDEKLDFYDLITTNSTNLNTSLLFARLGYYNKMTNKQESSLYSNSSKKGKFTIDYNLYKNLRPFKVKLTKSNVTIHNNSLNPLDTINKFNYKHITIESIFPFSNYRHYYGTNIIPTSSIKLPSLDKYLYSTSTDWHKSLKKYLINTTFKLNGVKKLNGLKYSTNSNSYQDLFRSLKFNFLLSVQKQLWEINDLNNKSFETKNYFKVSKTANFFVKISNLKSENITLYTKRRNLVESYQSIYYRQSDFTLFTWNLYLINFKCKRAKYKFKEVKSNVITKTYNNSLMTLKRKLQYEFLLLNVESLFNSLAFLYMRDNNIILNNIFKKLKNRLNLNNNIQLQPNFYINYLNNTLSNKKIVIDSRPWFVRGLFQYKLFDLDSIKILSNKLLNDKASLDIILPNYFLINSNYKNQNNNAKNILLNKLLNGELINVIQPNVFNKLIHKSDYILSRKPLNFSSLHISFSSQNYSNIRLIPESLKLCSSNNLQRSNKTSLVQYKLPSIFSFVFMEDLTSKTLLKSLNKQIGETKSFGIISEPYNNNLTNIGNPKKLYKTYCLSPFEGEIISSKQVQTKSQFLFLTKNDLISLSLDHEKEKYKFNSIIKQKQTVGQFIKYGDLITPSLVSSETGAIFHMSQTKLTVRRSQFIAASHKAVLHVKNNDWVEKNTPLITLPVQRLKAGDIVQGIPKIEQYFEARKSKAGRFYRDSIPSLMNAIFNHYLNRLKYSPYSTTNAARKTILKVQQILLNGIQRVYRTQGVSIADKHIEIIVRQMTSKVRILNPGLSSFLPGELVDVQIIMQLNRYLEEEIHFEPIVLGITQASLEVDSFISASSFQQTTRVLSEAALDKKRDYLRGLKENVILGNLMPSGTGHMIQQI